MPRTSPLHRMTSTSARTLVQTLVRLGASAALLLMVHNNAVTQEIIRGQSASGNASFSERASPSSSNNRAASTASRLPATLQQAASRYPVKMYASPDCNACKLGRDLLQRRGIPFQEYHISNAEEQRAANNMGITTLPHLMIGSQALKGFDSLDWTNYLTAAGYPENSALPANYQAPAVKSVIPDSPAAPAPANSNAQSELSTPAPAAETSNSPAPAEGFRF